MKYIFTGSAAFILFFLFDYFNFKNYSVPKNAASISGLGMFLYSTMMSVLGSPKIYIPVLVQLVSVLLFTLSTALLIYSLFLEIPFKSTYGEKQYNNSLVDTGTYALCRHPGVLWLFLSLMFLFLITGSTATAAAGVIWTGINIVYVYLQEKIFFCSMFVSYEYYQNTTPMLIPDIKSLKKCVESFCISGGYKNEELGKHD